MADTRDNHQSWTELLSDEDMVFIKRFVLASGSLKSDQSTAAAVSERNSAKTASSDS